MLAATMSNSTSLSEEASVVSTGTGIQDFNAMNDFSNLNNMLGAISPQQQQQSQQDKKTRRKRNLPGNPDPNAEVIALSPKTLMTTNRFVCEICKKGFQRDQNLQLHRRGHNLPWKLRQRSSREIRKRVYVCPEPSCVHHDPSRALGDLTGIKKHFCRKHGEKKWKCEKCSKKYAVQSDWKAHSKTCGTKEYKCDCGTLFSRKDSFLTHRAFCDALAEESARIATKPADHSLHQLPQNPHNPHNPSSLFSFSQPSLHLPSTTTATAHFPSTLSLSRDPHQNLSSPLVPIIKREAPLPNLSPLNSPNPFFNEHAQNHHPISPSPPSIHSHLGVALPTSASEMLLPAANTSCMMGMGAMGSGSQGQAVGPMGSVGHMITPEYLGFGAGNLATWQKSDGMTRDFLGLAGGAAAAGVNVRELLSLTGVDFSYDRDYTIRPPFGFSETWGDC